MSVVHRFRDRHEAGRELAARLEQLRSERPLVLGLPRGGVPVAYEVATALGAPLDVIVVRKLGVPFQPELGMGAIGERGVKVLNESIVDAARVTAAELAAVEAQEAREVARRARRYRGDRPAADVNGRTVVIVDDGLATGGTARAAIRIARAQGAARIVLAVPVGAPEVVRALEDDADFVVAVLEPAHLGGVGAWYVDFTQTSDNEVVTLLAAARATHIAVADAPLADDDVVITVAGVELEGRLTVPEGAIGIVLFAHGSGSGRHSPRNRSVARALNRAGLGTLLFDLLTDRESRDRANVFDVDLLATRLVGATKSLRGSPAYGHLPLGYFGASTGAAAALGAAARADVEVDAVVSRGGRPDLVSRHLAAVTAPTLLIVGGDDPVVIELNREAANLLHCEHRLEIVNGATHLFEEPGALETVAGLATRWFVQHLGSVPGRPEAAAGRRP
jgi:putative phosphoribosyl transferase